MFSTSLRATLIALAAIVAAVSVSATPGLSVQVTGPATVDGVENLKVITTATNTGDETLKLLNEPNGVLDTLPTDTFIITNDSGASPDFIGVRAKYSPAVAAASADPWAVTIIAPGTSVSFTHDLSSAYNFTSTGYSTYTVAPSSLFLIVNANNEISEFHADVKSFAAKVTNGKLAVAPPGIVKRATFSGCSAAQQTTLNTAASGAQSYARNALTYLSYRRKAASSESTPRRYAMWFGNYTDSRRDTVRDHFAKISAKNFSSFQYDCSQSGCMNSSVFAYVNAGIFGTINLCGKFWTAPATGTDSQAGTLVHEASHFTVNGGTQDYAYGQPACRILAQSDPDRAIFNADSHEYFAENDPAL